MVAHKPGILILTPVFAPNIGGVETHLSDLCRVLSNKFHVLVLTYQPITTKAKAPRYEIKNNIEIFRFPWFGKGLLHIIERSPLFEFIYLSFGLLIYSTFFMIFSASRRKYVNIIHAHGLAAAFVAYFLSFFLKKDYVVSIHWIIGLKNKPFIAKGVNIILRSAKAILTLSNASKEELISAGLPSHKVKVFRYWVDLIRFKPFDKLICKKYTFLYNKFVVLFVGRLIEVKGIKLIIEAAKRLSHMADIVFVIIGEGPLQDYVAYESLKWTNIKYLGSISNERLPLYYSAADVVIVPSIYEEGYGRVILEALACGTPVIASRKGGIPEALHFSVGVLIEPKVDDIVKAVKELYEDNIKYSSLRNECRLYAERMFSEKNADTIIKEYENIIKNVRKKKYKHSYNSKRNFR